MLRRDFLKSSATAFLAAGATLPAGSRGRLDPSKVANRVAGSRLALSCAAYSFRDRLDVNKPTMTLEEFIDLCAREELDAVELTSYYFRSTEPAFLRALRRRASVNGLAVSGAPTNSDFCAPPGAARDADMKRVRAWIDCAELLGAQTVRVFAGNAPAGDDASAVHDRCVAGLRAMAEYAGRHGVILGVENHGGVTATAEGLIALVEAVDSPWLGINLDTGNFHTDVYGSIAKAAPYAVAVQVKVQVREGDGQLEDSDLERVVAILRAAGYRGYVALEYESGGDVMEAVPRHLRALRAAIAAR